MLRSLQRFLAVDFDDAEGVPKLNADWWWGDQEQALLIACSSLIAIVKVGDLWVVQFLHFSVKEFLTSSCLAAANGEASDYHIDLEPAHMTLAQTCLGMLLQTQDDVNGHTPSDHLLAQYTARHWTIHTQFVDVSSRLQKGMEHLFDPDKLHFEVWCTLYDIDAEPDIDTTFSLFTRDRSQKSAAPLYYTALCGFHDLVGHLIIKYLQDVDANGGYYVKPLLAALAKEHLQTADLLRHSGANPHPWSPNMATPLHSAAFYGDLEVVQKLIEYNTNISAKDLGSSTLLLIASEGLHLKDCSVLLLLLEHSADVNAQAKDGSTPLHAASSYGALEVVRLLLEHGADVNVQKEDGSTPLHIASSSAGLKVLCLLLEHGADVNARKKNDSTPLHTASSFGATEVICLLLEHGANINARNKDSSTPLKTASFFGARKVVHLLLKHGAEGKAKDNRGRTALQDADDDADDDGITFFGHAGRKLVGDGTIEPGEPVMHDTSRKLEVASSTTTIHPLLAPSSRQTLNAALRPSVLAFSFFLFLFLWSLLWCTRTICYHM
jgi:ankyrin repeat protein